MKYIMDITNEYVTNEYITYIHVNIMDKNVRRESRKCTIIIS